MRNEIREAAVAVCGLRLGGRVRLFPQFVGLEFDEPKAASEAAAAALGRPARLVEERDSSEPMGFMFGHRYMLGTLEVRHGIFPWRRTEFIQVFRCCCCSPNWQFQLDGTFTPGWIVERLERKALQRKAAAAAWAVRHREAAK